MKIVEWPAGVNRIVTNDANISLGENGLVSDKAENGAESSRLVGSGCPNKFTVSMFFSNDKNDTFYANHTDVYGNHITEYKAWENWFRFVSMLGVNPFYFADLDNPDGGYKIYRISSAGLPKGSPNGSYVKVSMTWIEVVDSYITVQDPEVQGDYIDATDGRIELHLTEKPASVPVLSDFKDAQGISRVFVSDDGGTFAPLVMEALEYDGYRTVVLFYDGSLTRLDNHVYTVRVFVGDSYVEGSFMYKEGN